MEATHRGSLRAKQKIRESAGFSLIRQSVVASEPIAPMRWDVQGLIASESPVLLFGEPEHGKSWIAFHIASCIAEGLPVFGKFDVPQRRKSIALDFDSSPLAFYRRMQMLPATDNFEFATADYCKTNFAALLKENSMSFFVLDCFLDMFHPDAKMAPDEAMRAFVRNEIRKQFEANRCGGIIIDHSKRAQPGDRGSQERYYGSVQKKAAFRQMILCEMVKPLATAPPGAKRVKLTCVKQSEAEKFAPFYVELSWIEDEFKARYDGSVTGDDADLDVVEANAERVVAVLRENKTVMSSSDLRMETALGKNPLANALKYLIAKKLVTKSGAGKNTTYAAVEMAEAA